MSKVVLQLDELTCPSCMAKIEGALAKQDGVKNGKVLFNASKVSAELDESIITADGLANVIERLGYNVQSTKVAQTA